MRKLYNIENISFYLYMLKYLWKFLKYLEQWGKYQSANFWFCTFGLYLSYSITFAVLSPDSKLPSQSQIVLELLRAVGQSSRKGINSDFHRRLEEYFPDWENRMNYEEKQAKFYR